MMFRKTVYSMFNVTREENLTGYEWVCHTELESGTVSQVSGYGNKIIYSVSIYCVLTLFSTFLILPMFQLI